MESLTDTEARKCYLRCETLRATTHPEPAVPNWQLRNSPERDLLGSGRAAADSPECEGSDLHTTGSTGLCSCGWGHRRKGTADCTAVVALLQDSTLYVEMQAIPGLCWVGRGKRWKCRWTISRICRRSWHVSQQREPMQWRAELTAISIFPGHLETWSAKAPVVFRPSANLSLLAQTYGQFP